MGREVVSAPPPTLLEWGVAARALPGERASGDLHLVETFTGGVLVAVVDALGHGEDAAVAARLAVATLAKYAAEPVDALVQRCHLALRRRTRGVVMSLASFDATERTMTWLGIGNVEGFLYSADPEAQPRRASLVTRGGIVGSELPVSRPWVIPVGAGDTLLFATDGVRTDFTDVLPGSGSPQHLADRLLENNAKGTDDALVLVARYVGPGR